MKVCPLTRISWLQKSAPMFSLPGMSSTWNEYSCTAMAQRNTQLFWQAASFRYFGGLWSVILECEFLASQIWFQASNTPQYCQAFLLYDRVCSLCKAQLLAGVHVTYWVQLSFTFFCNSAVCYSNSGCVCSQNEQFHHVKKLNSGSCSRYSFHSE